MSESTPASRAKVRQILIWGAVALMIGGGVLAWQRLKPQGLPPSVASGNGRLEATDTDIATKTGGRVLKVLVREGDNVTAGQVLAVMDTAVLEAERARAQAQVRQAQQASATADALLAQRQQAVTTATALVAQRAAQLALVTKEWQRAKELIAQGFLPPQKLDEATAQLQGARAALSAARSQVAEAHTAITTTESQRTEAQSAIETARASVKRIEADLNEATLKAPRDGRIQVRAAEEGEVLGGGGRVLSMVDLSDVYMTFFLPETAAGRVAIGSEARLVLDAAPQYVIPAKVTFVASVAQFTPKTVETTVERQKLMFKVRAHIDPQLLARHSSQVKTGMPGMAYVRIQPNEPWPAQLAVNLPAEPAPTSAPASAPTSAPASAPAP
ncbi:MAG: HlyD family efflux transporter periplasmic adaptor subunit [Burkholderiales bacterium]|nr:HlyD family efflux transporter periplasmic adaptor subunit [Burkholderiales bacterium]